MKDTGNTSETTLILCVIALIAFGVILFISLIPNSPRIIITKPNRPSIQNAEVEPDVHSTVEHAVRRSLGIFEVTAYCPCKICCDKWSDGITASGYIIQPGSKFCAADPIIPFGKVLDIPGYGVVPVLDRGGKIKGAKIDVFFDTHKEALEWGIQELEIFCWVQGE